MQASDAPNAQQTQRVPHQESKPSTSPDASTPPGQAAPDSQQSPSFGRTHGSAVSQVQRTSISGQIVDKSGAVQPGVELIATNTSTKQVFSAVTGSTGQFRFDVPVGDYSIRASQKSHYQVKTAKVEATIARASFLTLGPEVYGQIKIHVNDDHGHGAAAIQVLLTNNGGDDYRGTTDGQGNFLQGELGGGTYTVIAQAGVNPCKKVKLDDGARKSVTLKLTERCR